MNTIYTINQNELKIFKKELEVFDKVLRNEGYKAPKDPTELQKVLESLYRPSESQQENNPLWDSIISYCYDMKRSGLDHLTIFLDIERLDDSRLFVDLVLSTEDERVNPEYKLVTVYDTDYLEVMKDVADAHTEFESALRTKLQDKYGDDVSQLSKFLSSYYKNIINNL